MGNNNFKPTSFFTSFHGISRFKVSRPPYKRKFAVIKVNTIAKVTILRKLQIEDLIHGSEIKIILCK